MGKLEAYFKTLRDISEHVAILENLWGEKEDNILDSYLRLGDELFGSSTGDIIYQYIYQTAIENYFEYSFDNIEGETLTKLGEFMEVSYGDGLFYVKMKYTDCISCDDINFIKFLRIIRGIN